MEPKSSQTPPPEDYWEEEEASKAIRGMFTNRLYVQHLGSGLLRLNYAEVLTEHDPQYHTALVMTAENAFAFGQLMQRMAMAALGQGEAPPAIVNVPETPNG
ncbi:MAG: hypothetical protein EOP61_05520 [Sphingomonadales bacterium]|nr:MAG: hypothetical protein EOP61_05520 [Sphingomonadales bacterium]